MRIPRDTVLMIVDVQYAIDDACFGPRNNPDAERMIALLLAVWREAGFPILHIRHDSTDPASPYRPGQPGHAFKPEALPAPGEPVLGKRANSAFIGTDLDERLSAEGRTTLVVCGVLTHNSLEATARHAGNLGYRVFVPEDACWSVDKRDLTGRLWPAEAVHALSLAHLHGEYAMVVTAAEAVAAARLTAAWRKR